MDAALVIIGVNHRTAPVAVRERFWFSESETYAALRQLTGSEGVEEAVLLVTCNRTEIVLWASDFQAAGASVRAFLVRERGLCLSEWKHFYRHVGNAALMHVFRVAASLDSLVLGEPQITGQIKSAWAKAQQVGASGRVLDAVFQKALNVSKRVRSETAIGATTVSIPCAAVELARQVLGSLEGRKVLVLGAGKMGELSARYLQARGARAAWVINRTYEHAAKMAEALGGTAVSFEDRWRHLAEADIVIGSTGCPHTIVTREDAERIHRERNGRALLLVDIAVPRDIDPAVREVPGMLLYDIDNLELVVARNRSERQAAATEAETIVTREAQAFLHKLDGLRVVPTLVALRERLEEICRQELARYTADLGPVQLAEEHALEALAKRIVQRVTRNLARELKDVPESEERDQLTAAVQRLFNLRPPIGVAADRVKAVLSANG